MKCDICKMDYPHDILSPLITNFGDDPLLLCGICALDTINKIHGMKRKTFGRGSIAEKYRHQALLIRRRNSGGVKGS